MRLQKRIALLLYCSLLDKAHDYLLPSYMSVYLVVSLGERTTMYFYEKGDGLLVVSHLQLKI